MSSGHCEWPYVPVLSGPRYFLHWASKFTGELVESSIGSEVSSFSEMIDRASPLREFCGPYCELAAERDGFRGLKKPLRSPEAKEGRRGAAPGSPLPGYSTVVGRYEIGPCVLASRREYPADSLPTVKIDMALLRFLKSGIFSVGILRPLRGISS